MGRQKKVAIIVAALVVFLGIGIALNVIGYNRGHSQGYELGKVEGYDEGHSEGYDMGQVEGYDEGHSEGYDEGQLEGYDKGHSEGYEEGHRTGYVAGCAEASNEGQFLINPSYQEMKDFLRRDTTDRRYHTAKYECKNFASDVCNNAEAEGIRAAVVRLEYKKSAHAIVAFETTDKGLIFIEPQEDKEVRIEVGIRYYGDTITRFIVTW